MSYKTILVHLDTSARAHPRLETALQLAKPKFQLRPCELALVPQAPGVSPGFGFLSTDGSA